jgi:hypothetical protein
VVARSKAWTVSARSKAGIVGSNLTQSRDVCIVCIYSVFVLFCVLEALRRADPRPRGPTDCVQDQETEKAAKADLDNITVTTKRSVKDPGPWLHKLWNVLAA